MTLYTIGHSNHSQVEFEALLQKFGIDAVVDVRSAPYSKYSPHFNRDALFRALPFKGISYHFEGKHLGGRPPDATCYKDKTLPGEGADYLHLVDYPAVMEKKFFLDGIDQLLKIMSEKTVALLCSEEDPARCHRHHLISKYLNEYYPEIEIMHVRGKGEVFNTRSLLTSVDEVPAEQLGLF